MPTYRIKKPDSDRFFYFRTNKKNELVEIKADELEDNEVVFQVLSEAKLNQPECSLSGEQAKFEES